MKPKITMHDGTDEALLGRRVAVVLMSYELGGAERQALHLASYLQDERGADVAVVALFGGVGDQPVRRMCIERRLACLRVNMPDHTDQVPTLSGVRQFARDLAFLRPDIVLPYTSLPNVLCGCVWRRAGAAACIWNQRDEGRELPPSRWQNLALKSASHFISNSRAGTDFLVSKRNVPRRMVDQVLNGVELPPPSQSREATRGQFGSAASSFVAVMLANIHRYKDHPTLIRAWEIVCQRVPELDPILVLAGRKDDAEAILRLIASLKLEGRVRLAGPVADVSSLLHACDLSVFSSQREGTPNAVLESMAAGRAVVATDIPGCRDALGEDYPALVPPGDAEAMAEQIVALAKNPARRGEVGRALAERARAEMSVGKMCEQTCRILTR